jgi:hypothetical protein
MYEGEKCRSAKKRAKNLGARKIKERGGANAKARNLRPKKERESASVKSSAKERKSASAKRKKKHVPSSVRIKFFDKKICIGTGLAPVDITGKYDLSDPQKEKNPI